MGEDTNPKSFSWQSSLDSQTDPTTGVTSSTTTDNQVLNDGTRIVKTTTTLKQIHKHGATTVTNTNTKRIETVQTEERIVGEELTFWDCFTCCCPCFKRRKKKGVDESGSENAGGNGEGEDNGGGSGGESKSKWKPVPND